MKNERLLIMIEIAIMATLAYILGQFKLFQMPQGGSICLIMLPIALISIRRGVAAGVITGFLTGLLDYMMGGYYVHPVQVLLDYPLAYASVGLVGLMRRTNKMNVTSTWLFLLLGVFCRFVCHFASAVIWFGEFAPEGMPVPVYAFVYNVTYLLPELILSGIVLTLLLKKAPRLAALSR